MFLSSLIHYFLELTHYYNNCCRCGNVFSASSKSTLSSTQWQNILNIYSHAAHLHISGGEPTLYPEFGAIIEYLDKNISVLFNNARWKDPDIRRDYYTSFRNYYVNLG